MGHFYGLNFCYNRLYLPYLNQQGFSMSTILFELGTEELPPKNLKTLRDALNNHVTPVSYTHLTLPTILRV